MERKRHQRIFAMLTVFAMLFCNDGFGAFAESISGGEQNLTQALCGKEEHRHTEECYENVTICGLNESKDKTEKRFNPFTVHAHGPECYNADGVLNCGIIEGTYYHTHNQYCFDKAGNLVCGLEEKIPHEHNDNCYETEKKLICDKKEEEGHKHSDACYKEHAELTCGKAEEAGHQHNDACYREHTELTCGKAEEAGHQHSDACYKEHRELTCGRNEDPGHHHSDACYSEQTELTCGKQEDPGHHHNDECYRDEQVLTCELPEDENHTHTEACYTTLHTLVCEEAKREGHTHSESCYTTTRKLTCGEAEREGHIHSENCYTTTRELVCGTQEREGHTHSESCYTTTRELACGKEEREGHTHGTSCYTTKRELICGKNESEGHKHTETCYTAETTLICTEPTTTHHHTGACRDTEGNLICGQQEIQKFVSSEDNWVEEVVSKGHHHSDACYEQQLVCSKEEHMHSDKCYAVPESTQGAQDGQTAGDEGSSANEGTASAGSGKATGESTGEGEDPENNESADQKDTEPAEETGKTPNNQAEEDPNAGNGMNPAGGETEDSDEKSTEESENPEKESTEISTGDHEKTGEESDEKDEGAEDGDNEEDGEVTEEDTDAENGEDEEDGEETGENKEKENEEEGDDEKDGAEDAEEGDGEETDEEELTEEQGETTITAEDAPYAVSISFSGEAGIPEGTKLVVSEAGEETKTKEIQEVRYASKTVPMKSAGLRSAATPQERHIDIPSMTVWSAGETVPDIILYQKTLDISLVYEEGEIEPDPAAQITVTVQLPDIEDGQAVEVRHITDSGAELLESSNNAGSITFITNGFSLFEFTSKVQALSTWSTGQTTNTFYGKTANQEAQASAISVSDVAEGLEVLEAYSLTRSSDLWMVLQRIADIVLGKLESIALYTVEDGQLGAIVRENVSLTDVLRFNLGDLGGYALVRDTGLRHIITELGNITLDGMMPKNSVADVSDVTNNYSGEDFQTETQPENEEDSGEKTEAIQVLAAYDISIQNNGEEYQPAAGQPISVAIRDDRIPAEGEIELWHIRDDGTREQVTEFTLEEGRVEFKASGFSVYAVIVHEGGEVSAPRVEFHFIQKDADSHGEGTNAYYEGTPYLFRNKHNDMQSTQILSNGESLELITDPGNQADQYFYGWYMVNPFVISGTTDEYGIGTGNPRKLYYTWPVLPEYITFESPISIQESNVEIGGTVHWSLNGASGSGTVDKDGCVHVFLAPLYEKYNFVNFMLYARDVSVSGANNLMTRKLIAMGSAESTEIKVSDIRSTSRDAIHLIFTGWEYQDKNTGEWTEIKTVDPTGAEIIQPGRDGVYLTGIDLDEGESIDLYPIFVEARWMDFVSGATGSGASFVGSCFLEAWGRATPDGTPEEEGKNVISTLDTSVRKGYAFEGWYAFALTDPTTGEITNLNEKQNVSVSYIGDDNATHSVEIQTKAVKIANYDGTIALEGEWKLETGDVEVTLFSAENGKLKFHDSLDRLKLYANWTPEDSGITVVYWTENAENDEYTSSAVRHITTTKLNEQLGTNYASGSVITREEIAAYLDETAGISVLSPDYLDDVGAVPEAVIGIVNEQEKILKPTDAIFFELNEEESDESKVIDGEGNAIFNVYFSRKIFKLVFHIGRDNYVKRGGNQRTDAGWDGNWIEYMYRDSKVNGPTSSGGLGYPEHTNRVQPSYSSEYKMTYGNKDYTSDYVTTPENVMGDYEPSDDENLYIIEAKYGADISSRWPSYSNPLFSFEPISPANFGYFPYIWSAYYGSLYCRIANERSGAGNDNGKNPDINGIYKYMSAELCANRNGDGIINENQVHHLVAWFGEANNTKRFKQYHTLYEAIDGTYDPDKVEIVPGTDYVGYEMTTWTQENTNRDKSEIIGHSFYETAGSPLEVLSNLEPQFQLGSDLDGYQFIYSCYEKDQRDNPVKQGQKDYHVYFFYRPMQYSLTFMYENADDRKTDHYYYKQSLKNANEYPDPEKEGYRFRGWFTNEVAGKDEEPFDFENATMPSHGIVLYPVFEKLEYVIKIDPNGGVIDNWTPNSSSSGASTGFRANYKEQILAYNFLERNYLKTSDAEIAMLGLDTSSDVYYYLNTQYLGEEHDGNFIPSRLRNALYLTASEIDTYWAWYSDVPETEFADRRAIKFTDKNAWMDAYFGGHNLAELTKYRLKRGPENYSFMGWYQVYEDGSVARVPFNFNTLITEDIEIRAMWRLDGGYYIHYDPQYYHVETNGTTEVVTAVIGDVEQWNDPEDPTQKLYADQSPTHILRGPTNITPGWVFRGWRIVRAAGTKTLPDEQGNTVTFDDWEPIQFDAAGNVVYYQPGDSFTVNSDYVTENNGSGSGAVIHMQAYYEPENTSARRPEIINLILDANTDYGGYVNSTNQSSLPALDHPGRSYINTMDHLDEEEHPTQILFGDAQSNLAVHLYRYATTKTFDSVQGTNYFSNQEPYFLIGFDENKDPLHPSTGSAYVPAYSPDSVIAATRESNVTLYAMWEPKIYITFVNKTDKDITVQLSGNGTSTVHVVNMVTGEYDREVTSGTVTVPAKTYEGDGMIRVVLPRAEAGSDVFTATALNDHTGKKISVSGAFGGTDPYGTGSEDIPYGYDVIYSGTLLIDQEGIYVTYTEKDDRQIDYDVNGGIWTDTAPYTETGEGLYSLDAADVTENGYRPSDPTYADKYFIGWTTNTDIAAHTDFRGTSAVTWGDTVIIPDEGSSLLAKVAEEFLWDFNQSPPYDKTLYAVWSDMVTVTFDLRRSDNKLHNWIGPETTNVDGMHVFYRESPTSRYVTYKLIPGETVPKPSDPTAHNEVNNRFFVAWLTKSGYENKSTVPTDTNLKNSIYDFSTAVTEDITLYTSWYTSQPQHYTFTVKNQVTGGNEDDKFTYTISIYDEQVWGKITGAGNDPIRGDPDRKWGSVSVDLKNNQEYTVLVTVKYFISGNGNNAWDACSVEMDVIDQNGINIKSGQITYAIKNTAPRYVGGYNYKLSIAQEPKEGYDSSILVENVQGENITYNTEPETLTYLFNSCWGSTREKRDSFKLEKEFFPTVADEQVNGFKAGEENSLTILFNNRRISIVAPTGFISHRLAYYLLLVFGFILMTILGSVGFMRIREHEDGNNDLPVPTDQPKLRTKLPDSGSVPSTSLAGGELSNRTSAIPDSATCTGNHMRRRNSVRDEDRFLRARGAPSCPQAGLYDSNPRPPTVTPPLFPRANPWTQTQGPPGKRGDPGG